LSNIAVHDQQLLNGEHQVSLVTMDGVLTYIVLENRIHLSVEEFNEIAQRVRDFTEEESDDVGSDE